MAPANTASARSSLPTMSLFRFLTSTLAIVNALISLQQGNRPSAPERRPGRTKDCFPDQRAPPEGFGRSLETYPNAPHTASPSERAMDRLTIQSTRARDGTSNHASRGRRENDAASRSRQNPGLYWFRKYEPVRFG